ncbi:hypothetical protein [Limosilactobacillus ingluviei]|mgnify:CR=1|uniref:hypothetical protein n=1 Tax=Limosilactobacillus ingluviei TaxID=148604 RepID=UPI00265F77BF|nr:hypothetical protein [Limosilactobacillus ingluviei]
MINKAQREEKGDYVMLLPIVLMGTVIALLMHVPIELIAIVVALIAVFDSCH